MTVLKPTWYLCLAFDTPIGLTDLMSADVPHQIELTAVLRAAPEAGRHDYSRR